VTGSDVVHFALVSFTTLLIVVDPLGVLPILLGLTAHEDAATRRAIVARATLVALAVALVFLVAGPRLLAYLGVTIHAVAISGGILLFATAVPMLFGNRPGTQRSEHSESDPSDDVAIFPLAIPLLAGPGTITTILLLTARSGGDPAHLTAIGVALVAVFVVTWIVLRAGSRLLDLIGDRGVHVATRVLGILLAALAVQYVLNGVGHYLAELGVADVATATTAASGEALPR
jgi:multiple antibiotic resistance protein